MSYNNNISVSITLESNEKNINAIYLDKIVYGDADLDSAQAAMVDSVAGQCIFSGGRAVILAREIKRMRNDTILYDDATLCAGSGSRLAFNDKKQIESGALTVIPNPAQVNCDFVFQLPTDEKGQIEVINGVGIKVRTIHVYENSGTVKLSLESFGPGIYHCILKADGNIHAFTKLVVINEN